MLPTDNLVELLSWTLRTGLVLCAPLLLAVLLTGLIVNILQVVTQIQDATVSFVPKLLVAGVLMTLIAPWMMRRLAAFASEVFTRIPSIG